MTRDEALAKLDKVIEVLNRNDVFYTPIKEFTHQLNRLTSRIAKELEEIREAL